MVNGPIRERDLEMLFSPDMLFHTIFRHQRMDPYAKEIDTILSLVLFRETQKCISNIITGVSEMETALGMGGC